jgi:hypothetical protein
MPDKAEGAVSYSMGILPGEGARLLSHVHADLSQENRDGRFCTTKNRGQVQMRQVMRQQAHGCGVVAGFLKSYSACVTQAMQENAPQSFEEHDLWLYRPDWATEGEGAALFLAGLQEGLAEGRRAFETGDLALIEAVGRIAGWTTKRHPRNYHWIYAERDAADGRLIGEAWRHFIMGWRQTGGDRRRIKGV